MASRRALAPASAALSRLLAAPSSSRLSRGPSVFPSCRRVIGASEVRRWASSSVSGDERGDKEVMKSVREELEKRAEARAAAEGAEASPSLASASESTAGSSSSSIPLSPPPLSTDTDTDSIPQSSPSSQFTSPALTTSAPDRKSPSPFVLPANITIPPEVRERLTEWGALVMKHSQQVVQEAQKKFIELGFKVNEMTGYLEVERLKHLVFTKEDELQKLRDHAKSTKAAYDLAITARSSAQSSMNALLERKHSWSDSDVSTFTTLVRADHSSSHEVARTAEEMKKAEVGVDKAFSGLMQTILQRYHEEQVWSDKIRSVSTWANVAGLALNLIVFIGAVLIVEPWKRKRLVEKLEERVSSMMAKVDQRLEGVEGHLERVVAVGAGPEAAKALSAVEERAKVEVVQEEQAPLELASSIPEIVSPSLAPSLPSPSPATISGPLSLPTIHPFFTQTLANLPPSLDPLAKPSQERDLAVAGLVGAVGMGVLMGLGRVVFG
ncbi:hypothetical protein B9479_007278 [Cryptococcus floricola]|uniref:Sensitive to high expression protein 9, mitochondrial n=1 Tax=Cryptococcus floricola TaxID=2591691 RepID=A0A5D3AMP8_9TREE|nr:hypothetical protein B9479_007278 [Cryptococcus floricola]